MRYSRPAVSLIEQFSFEQGRAPPMFVSSTLNSYHPRQTVFRRAGWWYASTACEAAGPRLERNVRETQVRASSKITARRRAKASANCPDSLTSEDVCPQGPPLNRFGGRGSRRVRHDEGHRRPRQGRPEGRRAQAQCRTTQVSAHEPPQRRQSLAVSILHDSPQGNCISPKFLDAITLEPAEIPLSVHPSNVL